MAADCKSAAPCGLRRFESSPVHQGVATLKAADPPWLCAQPVHGSAAFIRKDVAHVAQLVERVLGKDEVTSSILVVGSRTSGSPLDRSAPSMMRRQAIHGAQGAFMDGLNATMDDVVRCNGLPLLRCNGLPLPGRE